jgi:hypothetical protein
MKPIMLVAEKKAEIARLTAEADAEDARLRDMLLTSHRINQARFADQQRMQEMVCAAMEESWDAILGHIERFDALLSRVVAEGVASGEFRAIDPVAGKPSQTRWRLDEAASLEALGSPQAQSPSSRVLLEPLTGRSHQLRVHLKALGHPIVGDTLYASQAVAARAPRLLLHASALAFAHPLTGQPLRFDSPAPF